MLKKIIILTCSVLGILLISAINCEMAKYRTEELSFRLDVISKIQSDRTSVGLISRYLIIMNRIKSGGDLQEDYINESKLQGILPSMDIDSISPETSAKTGEISSPFKSAAMLYLRGIRHIIGKNMPEQVYLEYNDPLLDLAYFYLRCRRYKEALEIMDNIMMRRINLAGFSHKIILLYSGFCYALLSEYESARESYLDVINYFPDTKEAVTARVLMGFLEAVNDKVNAVLAKEDPIEHKAEMLYLLSSYSTAKILYGKYLKTPINDINKLIRAEFYRARSVEELGERDKAAGYYRDIIKKARGSKWGKMSNRRLLILGNFYGKDDDLARTAMENTKKLGDEKFLNSIQDLKDKMIEDKFSEKIYKKKYEDFIVNEPAVNVEKKKPVPVKKELTYPDIKPDIIDNFSNAVRENIAVDTARQKRDRKKMVRILSKDGFLFKGEIIHEDSKVILIKTEFGKIPVKKSIIDSIKRF